MKLTSAMETGSIFNKADIGILGRETVTVVVTIGIQRIGGRRAQVTMPSVGKRSCITSLQE